VVLYGCETWSPTLKEIHGLRVLEDRVLRRISEPKRDEIEGGWRNLDKELHNFSKYSDKVQDEMDRAQSTHGKECIKGFGRKTYKKENTSNAKK
jgi:hypothetical protein